jgi:hypothetical protein
MSLHVPSTAAPAPDGHRHRPLPRTRMRTLSLLAAVALVVVGLIHLGRGIGEPESYLQILDLSAGVLAFPAACGVARSGAFEARLVGALIAVGSLVAAALDLTVGVPGVPQTSLSAADAVLAGLAILVLSLLALTSVRARPPCGSEPGRPCRGGH